MNKNISYTVNPIITPDGPGFEIYASCGDIWDSLIVSDLGEEHRQEVRDFISAFDRREDVKDSDYFLTLSGVQGYSPYNVDKLMDEAVSQVFYKGYSTNIIDSELTLTAVDADIKGHFEIPEGIKRLGENAFADCKGLTSVTIPNSVTSIGDYAFYGCTGLTSVIIPNSVTNIGDGAFSCCSALNQVTIPDSVINIGEDPFFNCTGLTSITAPDSVTNTGDSVFSYYGDNDNER